jgi:hypothetical protein
MKREMEVWNPKRDESEEDYPFDDGHDDQQWYDQMVD